MQATRQTTEERFWAKVDTSGGPDACWLWTAGRTHKGYGVFWVAPRQQPAHRYSLALDLGRDIKPGLMACHKCDNPPCVNPDHLYEGTNSQNQHDRYDRGASAVAPACKNGHVYTAESTHWVTRFDVAGGRTYRICLTCRHEWAEQRRERRERVRPFVRRGPRRADACKLGHPRTDENSYVWTSKDGNTSRRCVICQRENNRARRLQRSRGPNTGDPE